MSLTRFIAILSLAALLCVGLTGSALLWISWRQADEDAKRNMLQSAESSAEQLGSLVALLDKSLNGFAQDPHLADVLNSKNSVLLLELETQLTRQMPGALLIRLLPANPAGLDEARVPKMGFADLAMVRQAATSPPLPAVHSANSPDAHLALARKLEQGQGVILASLSVKLLEQFMAKPPVEDGALGLNQEGLFLSYKGNADLKALSPSGEIAVSKTPWKIAYWASSSSSFSPTWFGLITLGTGLLFSGCAYLARRWLVNAYRQDQESIINLVRDFLNGNTWGNYPIQIVDGEPTVAQISQLKRTHEGFRNMITPERDALAQTTFSATNMVVKEVETSSSVANIPASIFRAYDIRGVVDETLTVEIVYEIGRAIGSEAHARGEQRVIIARDGRLSSPEFSKALAMGLQAAGRTVIDLGLAPTPLLYFATHVLNSKSGVMVTGSHNPSNYNGLKIVIGGTTLAENDIQALRTRIENNDFVKGTGKLESRNLCPDYIDRIVEDIQLGRPMKIVMDCGNGVAGSIAPTLMKTIGCEVVELFCEVDGRFPNHHPDPSKPENLKTLIDTVLREQADLGVAFDGDGDRLGVVDSQGKIIWPDRQMMLFAADVLSREPGADIIYDVKCTRHLASQVVKAGGRPLMWKTGHSLIKAKMKETGAALAGEMSGHIFFKERWYGFDDGVYACARLVEILSGDPRSTAEVFGELPDNVNTPELNVTLAEGENFSFVEKLRAMAAFPEARVTDIDGLRVDFVDGWGLVRASNTTPSLVIRFEADDETALARIQNRFRELMKQIKSDIVLPF